MNRSQLINDLHLDEGYRRSAYEDTEGYLTIGIGRMIDSKRGGGVSKEEAEYLLANDIRDCYSDITNKLPWFHKLDDVRQNVLLNMRFQLGSGGFFGFKNMLMAVQAGDYTKAAEEMKKSKWFDQVQNRAERLITEMETGQFQRKTE